MQFDLKKPCADCPFIKNTPMTLRPGRMEDIVKGMHKDTSVFACHKTTDKPPKNWQACMGALAYAWQNKGKRLPIAARIALSLGVMKLDDIEAAVPQLEKPGKWKRS